MSQGRALAIGILGFFGLIFIALVLTSGNVSATPSAPLHYEGDADLAQAQVDGICTGTGVEGDPYVFASYEIDCTGVGYGIWINGTTSHVLIFNCTFNNSNFVDEDHTGTAVLIYNCSNVDVVNCTVTTSVCGVMIDSSDNCTAEGMNITGTSGSERGILIDGSKDCAIDDAEIDSVYYGITIIGSENVTVTWSLITTSTTSAMVVQDSYLISLSNNTVRGVGTSGLRIVNSSAVTFRDSRVDVFSNNGLIIEQTDGPVDIIECLVIECTSSNGGIRVDHASNVNVTGCEIGASVHGIVVDTSDNVTIVGCDLTTEVGIAISGSELVEVVGCSMLTPMTTNPMFAFIQSSSYVSMNDSVIQDVIGGISVTGSHYVMINNTRANGVTSASNSAIYFQLSDNFTVSWSDVSAAAGPAISISQCYDFCVIDNSLSDSPYGGITVSDSGWGLISGNTFVNFDSQPLQVHGDNLTVSWNVVRNCDDVAMYLRLTDSDVLNNTATDSPGGFWLNLCSSVVMSGNNLTSSGGVIITSCNGVQLTDNIVDDGTGSCNEGITISSSRSCWIIGNDITGLFWYGIHAQGDGQPSDIRAQDNVLDITMSNEFGSGILFESISGADISGNLIDGTVLYGIHLDDVNDCRLGNNTIDGLAHCLYATSVYDAIIDSNVFSDAGADGMYISSVGSAYITICNNSVIGADVALHLINARGAVITGNVFRNFTQYGIMAWTSEGTVLENNTCQGQGLGYGIELNECDGAVIRGCNITMCYEGIRISQSASVSIAGTNSSNNLNNGLVVGSGCDYSIVSSSTFSNNVNGINCNFNACPVELTIEACMIENNTEYGVRLTEGTSCHIVGNMIANNGQYGVCLEGMSYVSVSENTFIDNMGTTGVQDTWSQAYDSEGNYEYWYSTDYNRGNAWSNQRNIDHNLDGIVDYRYTIDGPNPLYDLYPLPYGAKVEASSVPLNLTATVEGWYVHLEWDEPLSMGNSTLMDYVIYYGLTSDLMEMEYLGNTEDQSFDHHWPIMNGYTYYYAVIARNTDEFDSDYSNVASVVFDPFPTADHAGIVITSDADFASQADLNDWQGDGSAGDPYVISGYTIDGANYNACISISGTTVHFVIRDCVLYQGLFEEWMMNSGIVLDNAPNGMVTNCTFMAFMGYDISAIDSPVDVVDCEFSGPSANGVFLQTSSGSSVTGCTFTNRTSDFAIFLMGSDDCLITSNVITGSPYGIRVEGGIGVSILANVMDGGVDFIHVQISGGIVIRDNIGTGAGSGTGLYIGGQDCLVENNTISNYSIGIDLRISISGIVTGNNVSECDIGTRMMYCHGLLVQGNDISSNRGIGLLIGSSCSSNIIRNNVLVNNTAQAIYAVGLDCYDNVIFANYLERNAGSGSVFDDEFSQVHDEAYPSLNFWFNGTLGMGNYYFDWNSPDEDGDGIVDMAYGVGWDPFPLAMLFGPVFGASARVGPVFVNLTWEGLEYDFTDGTDGFIVYKMNGAGVYEEIGRTANHHFNDTDVEIGVTYTYRIAAYSSDDIGMMSALVFATPCDVPGAPTGLIVTRGVRSLTLTWSAPLDNGGANITAYSIYRGSSPSNLTLLATVGIEMLEYGDASLENGATYYYAVRAINHAGNGSLSGVVSNTTFALPGVPRNVITHFGDGNVTVEWNAPTSDGGTNVTGYVIEVTYTGGESYYYPGPAVRNWTVTGLTNGVQYTFRIRAVNAVGEGAWTSAVSDVPATTTSAPNGLEAVPGDSSVSLSWTAPSDNGGSAATSYNVYRMDLENGWTLVGSTASLSYVDTTAENGMVYYYRVSAVNKAGEGDMSDVERAAPGQPLAPTGLTATDQDGRVRLNWTAPADNGGSAILDYKVYRDIGLGFEYIGHVGNATLIYVDGTARPGIEYHYMVTAVTARGEGYRSNAISITLPLRAPEAPVIDIALQDAEGVHLTWHVPESSTVPDELLIYRGANATSMELIAIIDAGQTGYLDITGLAGMYYAMRSSNENGVGEMGDAVVAALAIILPPSAPQDLMATAGDAVVVLSWDASEGAVGYNVYRDNGTGFGLMATVSENECTDSDVVNGVTYTYLVTAFNDGGESGNSTSAVAVPGRVPGAVSSFNLTVGTTVVVLNWTAPSDDGGSAVLGYRVYREMNGTTVMLAMVSALTYTDHDIVIGVDHTYWVVALNVWGAGNASVRLNMTPAEVVIPDLPAPAYLIATVGDGTVQLSWDPMSGLSVDGFRVLRDGGSGFVLIATLNGTVYVDENVTNGVAYTYAVRCFIGPSEGANATVNATPGTVPGSPVLTVEGLSDRTVLTWTAPDNGGSAIMGYRVYRTPMLGSSVLLATVTGTSYQDMAALVGVNYTYTVTAVNAFGEGLSSNAVIGLVVGGTVQETDVPGAPTLGAIVSGTASLTLNWTAPADQGDLPVTSYNIYRGVNASARTLLVSVPVGSTSYADTTADDGVTYYYWVSAVNGWGEGDLSEASSGSIAEAAAPGVPTNVGAEAGQGRVTLTWSAPEDEGSSPVTSYRIYRSDDGTNWDLVATVPADTNVFVDGSVETGVEYEYKVVAMSDVGEGEMPDNDVFATPDAIITGEAEGSTALGIGGIAAAVLAVVLAIVAIVLVVRKR